MEIAYRVAMGLNDPPFLAPTAFPAGLLPEVALDGNEPPPFDAEHSPCLRGPCRHLFDASTHLEHGNAPGTLDSQPQQRHLYCMRHPGVEYELSADAPVLACNQWVPLSDGTIKRRAKLRKKWSRRHDDEQVWARMEDLERELARRNGEEERADDVTPFDQGQES